MCGAPSSGETAEVASAEAVPTSPLRRAVAAGTLSGMAKGFSTLEKNILKSKGVTDAQLKKLVEAGIVARADFATVGDAGTLAELTGLKLSIAEKVMAWSGAKTTGGGSIGNLVVESSDIVKCVHCGTKQPKDYKSGDLCVSCGLQAEPVMACYWCSSSGPGKFCRNCGAQFVPTGELELAILLKRDGLAKDEIPVKLEKLSAKEKDALWGRVRRGR